MNSSGVMHEDNVLQVRKNLKWFETRIENFNNADVPFQINALLTHRNNITKQYRLENFTAVGQERITADRTVRHLKQLLIDVGKLREQVKECDLDKFDKLVNSSRQRIISTLRSFDDYCKSLSFEIKNYKYDRNDENYDISKLENDETPRQKQIMLLQSGEDWELQNQIEISETVVNIKNDVQIVNEIFHDLAKIVNDQKETVDKLEDNVETSHAHVVNAKKELAQVAAKIHGTSYPILGALLGSCFGGPIGFVAGLKIGTIVAITGSLLGFSGGQVLKTKHRRVQREIVKNIKEQPTIKR